MAKYKGIFNGFLQIIAYVLLSFLFYEVIKSLPDISNTIRVDGFIIFSLMMLAIFLLFKSKIIAFSLNLISILFVLTFLFKPNLEEYLHFIVRLFNIIKLNFSFVWQREWLLLTAEFNTLMFLVLLSAVIFLVISLIKRNKGIWVVILVISYFAIIDTYLHYDSKWAIIKVLIIGLLFIGVEKQRNILKETKDVKPVSTHFLLAILIFSIVIVTPGYFLPKADPGWFKLPEPLAFMQGDDVILKSKDKKIGYGNDDSELGGPLQNDNTIIMQTVSTRRAYWRGESKDEYTGQGWVNSEKALDMDNVYELKIDGSEDYNFPHHLIKNEANIDKKEVEQKVFFPGATYHHFFFTGDFEEIRIVDSPDINSALTNSYSNKLYIENKLTEYYVKSSIPVLDINLLRRSNLDELTPEEMEYLQPYLQLPDTLPGRVANLSEDITSDYENSYDKALAIRNYLRTNYVYDLNAPYITDNDDFVDHFLFESKLGYCDHFSTSMVVMARSVGIPARWVKGFAPGELIYQDGQFVGTVRSNDAHSWVEVYFPEVGWVSFEPTPSFNFPQNLTLNDNEENVSSNSSEEDDKPSIIESESNTPKGNEFNIYASLSKIFTFLGWVILFLIIGALILVRQYKIEVLFWINKKRLSKTNSIQKMIILVTERMIDLLGRKHGKRDDSETVREYLTTLANSKEDNYKEVIDVFETARYSKNNIPENWRNKIFDVWKKLIK